MQPNVFNPRPYQEVAIARGVATPGFGLFVEPGGGKTVTAWTIADLLMNERLVSERVLVVGPKMVAQEVWWREQRKWQHLCHLQTRLITAADFGYRMIRTVERVDDVEVVDYELGVEDAKAVRKVLLDDPRRVHVVSRDHLYTLAKVMGSKWPYDLVIGDESTSYKNPGSKRSKAIRFLRKKDLIKRLILMSGTPSPKGLENLFAQVLLLDGGERLGETLTAFRDNFMVPARKGKVGGHLRIFDWKPARGAVAEVTDLIGDICMSVRASEWRQNEEPRIVHRPVTLPPTGREIYDRMEESMVIEFPTEIVAANAAVKHGKLSQIASGVIKDADGVWHHVHDAKLDALEEYIEELDGEPVLVLYWYQENLKRLRARFPRAATIKTPGFLDKFAAGEIPILLLNPAAAGHGLDGLQHGGHHVAVFDLHPDWELLKQAVDRIDRSGQKHQVTITQFEAEDTVDGAVADVLISRGTDQGVVMDQIAWRLEKVAKRVSARNGGG